MSLLLLAVLRSAGVTQPHWVFFLAPLLTLYTLGTGLAASAVRACIMAVVFWAAPWLRRRPDGLTALAWSGVLIVAWSPAQLFDPGFLFSFAAVAGLILLCPALFRRCHRVLRPDPWRLQAEAWWRRQGRAVARHLLMLGLSSLAACVASGPLTAHYFNLISPVSLLANLVIIPAAFLMMVIGCLTLTLGGVSGFLAEVFNHANRWVIAFMLQCVEWAARVPGGHVFVRSPSWLGMAGFYAGLALWMLGGRRLRQALLAIAVGTVVAGGWRYVADRRLEALWWRPGGALVAFINLPGVDDLLLDTGPRSKAREVIRQLRREGVDRLRALVLSSEDTRQTGGALDVLQQIPTREVWYPAAAEQRPLCRKILDEARQRGLTCRPLQAGDVLPLPGSVEWAVWHPAPDTRARRAGDRALVFGLTREGVTMLYLGSTGSVAGDRLHRPPGAFDALVVLPHPADLPDAEWRRLAPRGVLLASDAVGVEADLVRRLTEQGLPVWPLADGGAVRLRWTETPRGRGGLAVSPCP